jgi:hypothetical protein
VFPETSLNSDARNNEEWNPKSHIPSSYPCHYTNRIFSTPRGTLNLKVICTQELGIVIVEITSSPRPELLRHVDILFASASVHSSVGIT